MNNFEVAKVLTKISFLCLVGSFYLAAPAHAQQSAMVFFWAEDAEKPGATNWRPLGSGFLVSDQGVVLTAKHLIESVVTGERIIASISSKSTFPVPIDETDIQCAANRDACAVRIPQGAIPPSVNRVFDVECGDLPPDTKLRALGFTGGGDRFGGIIRPRGEVVGNAMRAGLIPTDLDLVPTMSGGPVLNDQGNVVAIVKGADSTSDNLTFVTPVASIKPILESLNVQCEQEIVQNEEQTQESVDEERLRVRCVDGYAVADLNQSNVVSHNGSGSFRDLFRTFQNSDRSTRCRTSFHVTWNAGDGHFFYLTEETNQNYPLIVIQNGSREHKRRDPVQMQRSEVDVPLRNGAYMQAASSITISGSTGHSSRLDSRTCGTTIKLLPQLYPLECAPYLIEGWEYRE